MNGERAEVVVRWDALDDVLGRYELPSWLASQPASAEAQENVRS